MHITLLPPIVVSGVPLELLDVEMKARLIEGLKRVFPQAETGELERLGVRRYSRACKSGGHP